MSEVIWDGVTQSKTLNTEANAVRQRLADVAKAYDWTTTLSILAENPSLINSTRPDGQSGYAVLHQAAHGCAPSVVIQQLINCGAWRSLRTTKGERAVDVAQRQGHTQLVDLLTPRLKPEVSLTTIQAIQRHFHVVILTRAEELIHEHAVRLPELEPLLELDTAKVWFPVPGMYGGFSYELSTVSYAPVLISTSWSRVSGGSGQRHVVSPHGNLLLEEGNFAIIGGNYAALTFFKGF